MTTQRFMVLGILMWMLTACALGPSTPPGPESTGEDETRTLASLEKADDYPLYTMRYYGDYDSRRTSVMPLDETSDIAPVWACALFSVLLDDQHLLYGRNFDFDFSPALLVFTDPSDGYASAAMVDMAYLDFEPKDLIDLTGLPLEERKALLDAPLIPFDGMNELGLVVGMAAVPPGNMPTDPSKETLGSLGIIREMLDHARNVDEAVAIIKSHNINFAGGPPVHYLIADAERKAILVEFYRGEMHVIPNEKSWHLATNFLLSSVNDPREGNCWRYDAIDARLNETQGNLDVESAFELLQDVSQDITQWSVVYQMASREVNVAMGRDYARILNFKLSDYMIPR